MFFDILLFIIGLPPAILASLQLKDRKNEQKKLALGKNLRSIHASLERIEVNARDFEGAMRQCLASIEAGYFVRPSGIANLFDKQRDELETLKGLLSDSRQVINIDTDELSQHIGSLVGGKMTALDLMQGSLKQSSNNVLSLPRILRLESIPHGEEWVYEMYVSFDLRNNLDPLERHLRFLLGEITELNTVEGANTSLDKVATVIKENF